jgi:hypothetical protein
MAQGDLGSQYQGGMSQLRVRLCENSYREKMWKIEFSIKRRTAPAQYDLALMGRNYFGLFYRAKTV